MQIRRFYCPELTAGAQVVQLNDSESLHALRVLRLSPGDKLQLLNGRGVVALAELMAAESGERRQRLAACRIVDVEQRAEPLKQLILNVAPPRGKTFDLVLKAATELGVRAIQPMICRYGVSKPEENPEKWPEVLVAAVKQSCNPWMPSLQPVRPFGDVLRNSAATPGLFGASPAAEKTAPRRLSADAAAAVQELWIGPEGGFAPEEEQALIDAGKIPVTIGGQVLRVETAVPAMLGYLYGCCRESGGR